MLTVQQCRTLMRVLLREPVTDRDLAELKTVPPARLEPWLLERMIGTLAYRRFEKTWPELTQLLQAEAFMTSAENSLHFSAVKTMLSALEQSSICPTLLKGSVLAHTVYEDPNERPMVDIDVWASPDEIVQVQEKLLELGYESAEKEMRPHALQALMQGTIDLAHPQWPQGNVDLHWSPFNGWWFRYAASIDEKAIWARRQKIMLGGYPSWQLSAEDLLIHLCVHLSIKSSFRPYTCFRAFSDIAHVIKQNDIDWDSIVENAKAWGLATTIWHTFFLLNELWPSEEIAPLLGALRPNWVRRKFLNLTVSPHSILTGRDLSESKLRFFITFSAIDTPRAAAAYVLRAVCPEKAWLTARYGPNATLRQHLVTLFAHE